MIEGQLDPVDPACLWCGEVVLQGDAYETTTYITPEGAALRLFHRECAIRQVVGSVAHQQGSCACRGGNGEDEPSLTRRQAAIAAAHFFLSRAAAD